MTRPKLTTTFVVSILVVWIMALSLRMAYVQWTRYTAYKHLITRRIPHWQELTVGRQPSLGAGDAKVIIVEFSDYQCPFCRILEPKLQELVRSHPNRVAIYRLNLPLYQAHPSAGLAATAAECASFQGVLEPFQLLLFEHHANLTQANVLALAAQSGVGDVPKFGECVRKDAAEDNIKRDLAAAAKLGISSTPNLIINGALVSGDLAPEDLTKLYRDASRS